MPKVAAIQMCSSHVVSENLARAAQLIAMAAQQGAELIVLPENFAMVGKTETAKVVVKEKLGSGMIQTFLAEQAKKYHVWIIGGTIPIASDVKDKVKAACLVYDAEGICVARYDKVHLFDVILSESESYRESASIEPGTQLAVVDTPVGKVGLAVCYDIRFPELFRCLFNRGATILALPAAFTVKTGQAHWELLLRARAVENFCYLIAAAQGGTHSSGRQTYGNSLIIEPWGSIIAQQVGTANGVICAELNLQAQADIRAAIPIAQHQKIFFDTTGLTVVST